METTFITIHDLSPEARILYSSDSIVDILGHTPDEVLHRSCWDFFHPAELPLAKQLHNRGVTLDKVSVLSYCRLKDRRGQWIGCECCFTVVYDVIVVCTSIYRRDATSRRRADEAPIVRRLFSSSPKDPRYHMLQHLSAKFKKSVEEQGHEPRAALFLNRFTRTSTITYATSGIDKILGMTSEDVKGRSFYYCIAESCLEDAIKCVETAKGNNSIAYLRFRFRDPRLSDESNAWCVGKTDAARTDVTGPDDESSDDRANSSASESSSQGFSFHSRSLRDDEDATRMEIDNAAHSAASVLGADVEVFNDAAVLTSAMSAVPTSPDSSHADGRSIELEAVVSCTSDGLVVILRRARPTMPGASSTHNYSRGFFAAPWGRIPRYLPAQAKPHADWVPGMYAPPERLGPQMKDVMDAVREVAVFAWALTGMNGSMLAHARGTPHGESQPVTGLPVWSRPSRDDDSGVASQTDRQSQSRPATSDAVR